MTQFKLFFTIGGYKMAQGYFEIRFRKDDGSNDVELMEKVIDWCKSNYEWFQDGIDDGQINADGVIESVNNNGLVESEVPDEALEEDFIEEIFNEFKPLDMKAVQILGEGEYGDAPYSYNKWITVCDNGEPRLRGRSSGWD